MNKISVAIDGPAGAGKSTISKIVARELGFVYIDTGAMYRAVALYAIEHGADTKNTDGRLVQILDDIKIDIVFSNGSQKILLDGRDVSEKIREPEVSIGSSNVAAVPEVRLKLVELQRQLAEKGNVIMDGRDIGTYVLPDADIKIFLTASVEDRAKRRYAEQKQKGIACDLEEVKRDIEYRDHNDSSREFAPLCRAQDAVLMDTTGNELEESVQLISNYIKERLQADVL